DTGMAPALDSLDLIARAVTPPGRPRRFNARFFMARAEDATGEIRHSSEMGDVRWVRLDEARELPLPTITGLILGEIGPLVKAPARPQEAPDAPAVRGGPRQPPDERGLPRAGARRPRLARCPPSHAVGRCKSWPAAARRRAPACPGPHPLGRRRRPAVHCRRRP